MSNYDEIEKTKNNNEQYLKELKEYPYTITIKTKHFNGFEIGELPWVSKLFLMQLNSLYDDGVLTHKPVMVKAVVNNDIGEPKLRVDYTLG